MIEAFRGKRIGVVLGGLSAEREVSLKTGAGVHAALVEAGYTALALDWARGGPALPALLVEHRIDVVWNALHGTFGEDGAVQGLCACLGVPCTGSGILASALAMDKVASKRIFESHGIPTPRWRLLPGQGDGPVLSGGFVDKPSPIGASPDGSPSRYARLSAPSDGSDGPAALADFGYPLVVKPADEGSSVGVSVVDDASQCAAAVALARQHHGPVLVEEYIAGTEVFVGIVDGEVLGSVEVRPATRFYDYEAKYLRNDTQYLLPPEVAPDVLARCEAHALAAYKALGCSGHARPDLRIDRAGNAFVLEVNTLPGMTATSLLPKIAKRAGLSYAALCERVLAGAR